MDGKLSTQDPYVRDQFLTVCPVRSLGPTPAPMCGHSCCVVSDGKELFVYGGANEKQILDNAYIYNVAKTSWRVVETKGKAKPGPLFGHSTIEHNGMVFLFGGLSSAATYNLEALSSSDSKGVVRKGSAGKGRYLGPKQVRGRLFVHKDEEASAELYTFRTSSLSWAAAHVQGTPPSPRYMHSVCKVGNLMIVFGGVAKPSYRQSLADLHVLNLESLTWSQPKTKGPPPAARHGHVTVDIGGGTMLLHGGSNEDASPKGSPSDKYRTAIRRYGDVYFLDTTTWTWSCPELSGTPPIPRAFHSSAVVQSRFVYIFAGETRDVSADLVVLDINKRRWTRPLYDGKFEHEMHSSVVVSNRMLVLGGLSFTKGLLNDFFFLNTVHVDVASASSDYTFKIVLAGDSEVGKSCLMLRFVEDSFSDLHASTIGVDFKTVTTMIENKIVKLHIWDTAGQERFSGVTSHYYRGAHGAVVVYDVTNKVSFESVENWIGQVDDANSYGGGHEVFKLVVGNKCDLENAREVKTEQGKALAEKFNAPFLETSAKSSANVDVAFLNLAKKLMARGPTRGSSSGGTIKIEAMGMPRKSGCCS